MADLVMAMESPRKQFWTRLAPREKRMLLYLCLVLTVIEPTATEKQTGEIARVPKNPGHASLYRLRGRLELP